MFKGVVGAINFEEMKASTYEAKFWEGMGGYDEDLDADLAEVNTPIGAIESARQNGHSPERLAQMVKESTK